MPQRNSITIKLTTKQRQQIVRSTGHDLSEVKFESLDAVRSPMAGKTTLGRKHALTSKLPLSRKRALVSKSPLSRKRALVSKSPLSRKRALVSKSPLSRKLPTT
jgi:hypothetical protein